VSQPQKQKKEYTFAEDTLITAQAAVNIVLSTRKDVDPVPFIAALLEGYARRVQTDYSSSSILLQPPLSKPRQRRGKSKKQ